MRNVHRELNNVPENYTFNAGCPASMYKTLIAFTLSRIEQILEGSSVFTTEEAWLIRRDISSLKETLISTTGAHHSQAFYKGEELLVTADVSKEYADA